VARSESADWANKLDKVTVQVGKIAVVTISAFSLLAHSWEQYRAVAASDLA